MPYAVHMQGALTGHFIGSVTRRVHDGREPPPPRKAQVRAGPMGGLPRIWSAIPTPSISAVTPPLAILVDYKPSVHGTV